MKRIFLAMTLLFLAVIANAQTIYRCTGDNVNVRTGPGKNYAVMMNDGFQMKCQLFKDSRVRYAGKQRNGFTYVKFLNCGMTGASCYPDYGWVATQYLKPMTRRCPECKGKGYFNRPCKDFPEILPDDHPSACPCSGACLHDNCRGKQHCHKCGGLGYL